MDPLIAAFGAHALAGARLVLTPDSAVADALAAAALPVVRSALREAETGAADAVALLGDELSHAGERAEELVAEAARVLRPGGLLAATAAGVVVAHGDAPRAFRADELATMAGLAGFEVTGQWAPGAAAVLRGVEPAFEPVIDRMPGLLDASPRLALVARRYHDEHDRSRSFFASLPRKVVAAAVVCRDGHGRILVVFDTFKQHWTIPGGVVDADEDPRAAAVREAREEAGVDVDVDRLLGVFAMSWPDRLLFVFDARPRGEQTPRPVHAHEIAAAEWVPFDAALARVNPRTAGHVRRCLDHPGDVWHDPLA